jgi:LacI family transcriptional regulator
MSKRPISSGTLVSSPTPAKTAEPSLFSQIAAKVGVTPAAVTLAMQDSSSISAGTKQRVFWASRQLGYRASRAKQKQLLNIAVIVGVGDSSGTLQNSRNVEIWEGVSSYAEDNEMSLHTYILPPPGRRLEFKKLPVLLRRDQLDGVIVMGLAFNPLLDFLHRAHIPTVVASNLDLSRPTDQIRIDMTAGARMLTLKLIERGHRRIGYLINGSNILVHKQIFDGYEQVMREHDLFDSRLVRLHPARDFAGTSPADGLLAEKPRPTCVVTPTSDAAHHVAFAAIQARIGFTSGFMLGTSGHEHLPGVIYPIVHLNSNLREAGIVAFKRLMELIESPRQAPKTLAVDCTLDERACTAE